MANLKKIKNIVVVTFIALVTLTATVPIHADIEPLKIAPNNALFLVRINNLDYTLSQTDQFLAGVSPVPLGLQMMIRMQLAQMLGNPALTGVNTAGTFVIFGAVSEGEQFDENSIAILIPVTDYKQFISSNANLTEPDPNGVSEIESIGGFVTQVGSFAMIKPPDTYNSLVAAKKMLSSADFKSLAAVLDQDQLSQAAKSPLWFYSNLQLVNKTFAPQISAAFEEMQKQMEQVPPDMQASFQNPAEIMKIYFDFIKAFLNQSKSLTVSLTPKPDVLNITETISALPGTTLADLFTDEATTTENKLLCYLKDGTMVNATGKISEKFNTLSTEFAVKIFGEDITEEQKAKLKNFTTDWAKVFTGYYAGSFFITPENKPPFVAEIIYEVKDKTKFDEVMEENATFLEDSGMIDFYKNMGIDMSSIYTPDVDSYKGFSIDSAKFLIKPTDPNSPEAQIIEAMYGEGIETRWALAGDLCVYTVGANADSQIKKLIDEVTAPGLKEICSEIKTATELLPGSQNADLLMTFNILRVLKIVPAMMPLPVPMPDIDFTTTSNIAIAANTGENKLTVDIAIPKQHLMELMQAVQMMMIQQQQTTLNQAKINTTKANLKTLHNAVLQFKMDTGRFPIEEEGLQALIEQPTDVENYDPAGYLEEKELPKDAWGNDFIYELNPESGEPFVIRSCGPDGQPNTNDDLLSTDAN